MESSSGPSQASRGRKLTFGLLGLTAILVAAASIVGISDNLPGALLLYGAGLTLVLAGVHRWRDPRRFITLFAICAVGFFVMVVVHNFAEVGAERIAHLPLLAMVLSGISVIGFILAVILCPMGGLVGLAGSIIFGVRDGKKA